MVRVKRFVRDVREQNISGNEVTSDLLNQNWNNGFLFVYRKATERSFYNETMNIYSFNYKG